MLGFFKFSRISCLLYCSAEKGSLYLYKGVFNDNRFLNSRRDKKSNMELHAQCVAQSAIKHATDIVPSGYQACAASASARLDDDVGGDGDDDDVDDDDDVVVFLVIMMTMVVLSIMTTTTMMMLMMVMVMMMMMLMMIF